MPRPGPPPGGPTCCPRTRRSATSSATWAAAQGYCDVSSGTSGTLNSVYFNSDGTTAFFRIRLAGDPRKASAGGFQSTTYMLQIAVGGVARVAVGLDGKNPQRDFVYVANADGTAHTEVYATPFNNAGGEFSAGARGLPDGEGQYFVDWQVPLSRITQRSGGAITGSTPVQLFFGTSQSANLAVLNKDFMIGNAVNFGGGSTVTLVPPPPVAPAVVPPAATPAPKPAGRARIRRSAALPAGRERRRGLRSPARPRSPLGQGSW